MVGESHATSSKTCRAEVQGASWEIGTSVMVAQAGTRYLKKIKKGQQESSECKHFCSTESYMGAEQGRKEGEERRMGGTGNTTYPRPFKRVEERFGKHCRRLQANEIERPQLFQVVL
jgi:hypothetical protein